MTRPLTELEEQILRKHVANINLAMDQAKYLCAQIDELEEEYREHRDFDTERRIQALRRELSDLHDFLRRIALMRREILLHMHLDKLEGLGLSYPEAPVYLNE